MEVMLKRSSTVKEETTVEILGSEEDCGDIAKLEREVKRSDVQRSDSSSPEQNDSSMRKQVFTVFSGERKVSHTNPRSPSLNPKDSETTDENDQLETTKAEMGEVREENERLKTILARIMKDYQSLQMHLFDVVQQDHNKKPPVENSDAHQENEESELVSLSLGSSSRDHRKGEKTAITPETKEDERMKGDLSLGLNSRFDNCGAPSAEGPSNSSGETGLEEPREEDGAGEPWHINKSLKMSRPGDEDLSHRVPVKNARVSVRARCDTPTMNDGCQWRKYGQKIAKGNPCPRAYYRCTVAPACPVRKQVQRCADDMSILITTYEGTHNHPLPVSATAMASTTAAAASMLMSGSSVSRPAVGVSALATSPAAASNHALQGLNFGLSDFSRQRQFYLPNPSISSYSSYPTITLDLTSPPSASSPSLQFKKFSTARVAPTNLSFSSSEPTANPYLGYGTLPYNKNQVGFFNLGRQPQEAQLHQPFLQKTASSAPLGPAQNPLSSTIAAATKAITSDPSFQSALAVAISSIVGGQGNQGLADTLGQVNLKWGDQPPPMQPLESSVNVNGCGSSYLTRSTSSNSIQQQANHPMFPRPSETTPASKSGSASPVDNRDQMN